MITNKSNSPLKGAIWIFNKFQPSRKVCMCVTFFVVSPVSGWLRWRMAKKEQKDYKIQIRIPVDMFEE